MLLRIERQPLTHLFMVGSGHKVKHREELTHLPGEKNTLEFKKRRLGWICTAAHVFSVLRADDT